MPGRIYMCGLKEILAGNVETAIVEIRLHTHKHVCMNVCTYTCFMFIRNFINVKLYLNKKLYNPGLDNHFNIFIFVMSVVLTKEWMEMSGHLYLYLFD